MLGRHRVDYLLVGGGAARLYGADRLTMDTDCLARHSPENLGHLAIAMRELGARLRVEGLPDDEAAALPVRIDAAMLAIIEISTWSTDAGWFDVLANIPARDGRRLRYAGCSSRCGDAAHRRRPGTHGAAGSHRRVQGVGQPTEGSRGSSRASPPGRSRVGQLTSGTRTGTLNG